MKITLIKHIKEDRTFSLIDIEDLVRDIQTGKYANEVSMFRYNYPELRARQRVGDSLYQGAVRNLPHVCFAAQWRKQNGITVVKECNNLMMLEIKNLRDEALVNQLKRTATQIPYTRLCFVGATRYDLVIVCQVRYADDNNDEELLKRRMENALSLLHYHYSVQLQTIVDPVRPSWEMACPVSVDERVFYNSDSEPFFVGDEKPMLPKLPSMSEFSDTLLPGTDAKMTNMRVFEWCLMEAMNKASEKLHEESEYADVVLHLLSDYCHDSGLPIDFSVRRTAWRNLFSEFSSDYITEVFNCAYEKDVRNRPLGHLPKSALLMMRTEMFLKRHYELRRNVMTGVVQYRNLDGYDATFHDLTVADRNSMTSRALKAGLGSWDKDIKRFIDSNDITQFDPVEAYLSSLPEWDGENRVSEFVSRLFPAGANSDSVVWRAVRIWLLSMVAHWLGKDTNHGNALVPLLIGGQGCGKTSFCNIVLPPELRDYYNDKVTFTNETALSLGLSSFALINIDEFDSLKRSQQPTLKYLLSKSDVKMRPPYGVAFVCKRRYASFIATTNNPRPLTDPTGSRRFICIEIPDGERVDYMSPVAYEQLYAQLLHEVNTGARYWLDDEETRELIESNCKYQKVADLGDMLSMVVTVPNEGDKTEKVSVSEIISRLCRKFPDVKPTRALSVEVGKRLSAMGMNVVHTNRGQVYIVKR